MQHFVCAKCESKSELLFRVALLVLSTTFDVDDYDRGWLLQGDDDKLRTLTRIIYEIPISLH